LKQGTIKKALRNFGLTEKEAELYIFLGKRGPLKTSIITKQLKMNRGQVYRILKNLQKKELVEATLEYPTRFATVSFENVINSLISSKREEVLQIEKAKKDLLSDWKKISQKELKSSLERFAVIEGNKKIYHKISKMVKETNSQFLIALTVTDLCRAERLGIFDFLNKHPMKSSIHFRILTQSVKQNLNVIKLLKAKLKPVIDFRGIDPSLGSPNFSRMAIRDNDEVILFISDKVKEPLKDEKDLCLSTNCKSIIEAFSDVFENLWKDSTDIKDRIIEIDTGKCPPRTQVIKDPLTASKIYNTILNSVKEKILILTSAKGLIRLSKHTSQLQEWLSRDVNIRIMAPIISENLGTVHKLLKYGEIRHIPLGYFDTTIIDNEHLFRFEYPSQTPGLFNGELNFNNMFYTNDLDHIIKTTELIYDMWNKTRTVTPQSARSIIEPKKATKGPPDATVHPSLDNTRLVINKRYFHNRNLSEKDVLDKIKEEKSRSNNQSRRWYETVRIFGSRAFAVIRPPDYFNIPDMVIGVLQDTNESSFGTENTIFFMLWLETTNGFKYVPVTIIQDTNNPESIATKKANLKGTPAAENIIVLNKDELQIQIKEKTLFAGWTKSISLGSLNNTLPPCCILFEGYGEVKPGAFTSFFPSGRKHEVWYLTYNAFVSFYHPQEKYVGSGTDAFFDIDALQIMYPIKLG